VNFLWSQSIDVEEMQIQADHSNARYSISVAFRFQTAAPGAVISSGIVILADSPIMTFFAGHRQREKESEKWFEMVAEIPEMVIDGAFLSCSQIRCSRSVTRREPISR
jgi:hypothetical protein